MKSRVRPEHQALLLVEADPRRLLQQMRSFCAPATHKWIDRAQS